jgi:hypothetical protein
MRDIISLASAMTFVIFLGIIALWLCWPPTRLRASRPGFSKIFDAEVSELLSFPPVEPGFHASHVSVSSDLSINVRYFKRRFVLWVKSLNYAGKWDPLRRRVLNDHLVLLDDPPLQKRDTWTLGLEDIRLHPGGGFSCGTREFCTYTNSHRILHGSRYPQMSDVKLLRPPTEKNSVEKNWIFLNNDLFIYTWHPLTICKVDHQSSATFEYSHQETPDFYANARGSTPPVSYDGKLLILTHERVQPNFFTSIYRHCWNCFDEKTLKLVSRSPTFHFFEKPKQAYCLSCLLFTKPDGSSELQLFVNIDDREVYVLRCAVEAVLKQLRSLEDAFPEDELDGFGTIRRTHVHRR